MQSRGSQLAKQLSQYFFRGLITALPLGLTVYLFFIFLRWTERVAMLMIQPFVGDFYVPGLGLLLGVVAIFLLGFLVSQPAAGKLLSLVELPFTNLPVVKSIYSSLKDFADYFSPQRKRGTQQTVVALKVPGQRSRTGGAGHAPARRRPARGIPAGRPRGGVSADGLHDRRLYRFRPARLGAADRRVGGRSDARVDVCLDEHGPARTIQPARRHDSKAPAAVVKSGFMQIECYAQRMLNPFRGVMHIIRYQSAEAMTTDGIEWDIYVANDALLDDLGRAGRHAQISDIRYGHWSAEKGLKRGPLYPSDDFKRLEHMGAVVYEHLLKVHREVPFKFRDRFELWLLDRDGLPLALLHSVRADSETDTKPPLDWRAGMAAQETFPAARRLPTSPNPPAAISRAM